MIGRLAIVTVLLLGTAGLAGCRSPEARRDAHLERAQEFLAEGKSAEALIELRNALKLDPKSASLNQRIGAILEHTGRLADALFFFQEAHRLAPEDADAALAYARLSLFDNPELARTLIDGVIEREPDNAKAWIRRSELALAQAKADDALAAALTASELAPNDHMALFQVGIVQRARIRERELRRQPPDPALFEQALAAFDRGLAVAPDDAPVEEVVRGYIERALVFASWPERRGEAGAAFEQAAEAARQRSSVVEEQRTLDELRRFARATGDTALERRALERQVEIDPANLDAWGRLIAASEGDEVPKRLIQALPDEPRAHALYAQTLARRGRGEEAVAYLREVEGRLDDPVPLRGALAALHIEAGRFDEAHAIERQMREESPERPETDEVVGLLAMREGRFADAAAASRRLIERQETPHALLRLGEAEFRLGNYEAALGPINRALELSGDGPQGLQALRLRGLVQIASGDAEGGVQTFGRVRRVTRGSLMPEDVGTVASALYATGRAEAARELLDTMLATEHPPLDAVVLYLRKEGPGNPQRAQELLERALAERPFEAVLIGQQIRLALAAGEKERAEQIAAEAVAARPEAAIFYRQQAQVLLANGKPEQALAAIERAVALLPELPGAADLLTGLLTQLGREQEAVDRLEARARAGKLPVSDRVLLARLQIQNGNDARAIELLESVVAERNDLPGARNDLAFLLARQGTDLERALDLAQEARSALPRSPEAADTLGLVYLRRNLPEAAVDQFRAAIELAKAQSPAWATSQYHLGLGLKALGRHDEARQAFERALAAATPFPELEETRREIESLAQAPAGSS
ncbi:MAG: tetratricopeptide repeat protein [Deltaproteobacteria bacterium]|nr:tetratricopeptide repeat protein [Deltaproteobacteria bacterium]